MSKIVTIISGKGGNGKTTVAVNVASSLKLLGKRTLLIDCGFGIRNDDIPLGVTTQLLYNLSDVIASSVSFEDAVISSEKAYVPDFLGASVSACPEHFASRFSRLLSKLSHHYDYIVIDTPSSTGSEFEACTSSAQIILAVSEPDVLSLQNTALCINRVQQNSPKEIYLVLNKVLPSFSENRFLEDIVDDIGAKLIGIIRQDEFVLKSLENGDPIVRYDTYAGRELENITLRLNGQYVAYSPNIFAERFFAKKRFALKIHQGGF